MLLVLIVMRGGTQREPLLIKCDNPKLSSHLCVSLVDTAYCYEGPNGVGECGCITYIGLSGPDCDRVSNASYALAGETCLLALALLWVALKLARTITKVCRETLSLSLNTLHHHHTSTNLSHATIAPRRSYQQPLSITGCS